MSPAAAGPAAQLVDTGVTRWSNWHENFEQPLFKFYDVWNADPNSSTIDGYRNTTRLLQQVVSQAIQDGRSVRALGGSWSMMPVAATDGVMLNTRPLNYRFALSPADLDPGFAGTGTPCFVQCGISMATLNSYLEGKSLALRTSGASNGQTIAGALSTGTHGAALRFGSVPDYVIALHIVTEPGRSVWLERLSAPVVNQSIAQRLDADLIRDDALFEAALVSFGSFGLIHGVVVEADPLYFLHSFKKRITLDDAMWAAIEAADFSGVNLPGSNGRDPYHYQLIFNPFDSGVPQPVAVVMYREPQFVPGAKRADPFAGAGQGDAALEMIGKFTDAVGPASDWLEKLSEKFIYKEDGNVCGTPGQTFSDTTTRGHAASCAMGVPLDRIREAWETASKIVVQSDAPSIVSLRLVKSGRAMLGFIRHQPVTAVLEVDGPDSNRVRDTYRQIWAALTSAGIPHTFHWGKLNNLDSGVVRSMYGSSVGTWMNARRTLLPRPELRRAFANAFTNLLQLSD